MDQNQIDLIGASIAAANCAQELLNTQYELEAAKQRELELLAVIADMRWSMRMLLSGSCTCLTKTPVYTQHKENCTYRLLQEALVRAEVPSQALREHEANVIEPYEEAWDAQV